MPNGEVEGPDDASGRSEVDRSSSGGPDAAGLEPRADNLPQRPRRHYRASRPPPTIVRRHTQVLQATDPTPFQERVGGLCVADGNRGDGVATLEQSNDQSPI